jgi:hypothetical protein
MTTSTVKYMRTYYEANKEKLLAKYKEQYKLNPEPKKARAKARYLTRQKEALEESREWKRKNPEKFKASQDKWNQKHPLYSTYHNAKRRAKDLELPFDIHWKELVMPEYCPILGVRMDKELDFDYRPSLDRVDPTKGYVKGNIAFISMKANRMKAEGTAEEHRKIADYIDSFFPEV